VVAFRIIGLALAVATLLCGLIRFEEPSRSVDLVAALMLGWLIGWVMGPILWLLVVAPVMVALTVSLTAFSGQGWAWPWVLATLPAMLGATAGLGVLLSVTRPVRQKDPNRRTGPFDTGDDPNAAGALIGQQYLPLVLAALAAVPAATLVLLGGLRASRSWTGRLARHAARAMAAAAPPPAPTACSRASPSPPRARPSGRSCQRLDRRRGDDPFDLAHQLGVEGDERIRLQLGECDVLGVVGLGPPQPVGELPGPTPEDGVAEEADRQRPDAGEPVEGDIRRDLALVHGLVKGRQSLGAQQRRRKELVLGRDLDPFARQLEDDAAVDDESGHLAVTRGRALSAGWTDRGRVRGWPARPPAATPRPESSR
jgi:hypothetical protein